MVHTSSMPDASMANTPSFIETQFPVAKLSMESYAERRSNQGQSITSFGKWWGRKPLILVRATILGLLLPATSDPARDRDVFLRLLTMDTDGLRRRKSKAIPVDRLTAELAALPATLQNRFLEADELSGRRRIRSNLDRAERTQLQMLIFDRLTYADKLTYCDRPEQIDGPSPESWIVINTHLQTDATTLAELVEQLGARRFGRRPRVGDAFCGGGSVPFEAARIGCDAFGSDLNPAAALMTWAALHVAGGDQAIVDEVATAQQVVFDAVDRQIQEWGIEQNGLGWRADAYLYCTEGVNPESGPWKYWRVPLASSWLIAPKSNIIGRLLADSVNRRFTVEIDEAANADELRIAAAGTVINSRMVLPDGITSIPMETVRRDLRLWESTDIVPRPDDVFQERLYCIRWEETYTDERGNLRTRRHYRAPTQADWVREERVLTLLRERWSDWQAKGYLPTWRIEPGSKTDEPIRTRGWTHWHQLFTPRQLLILGLLQERSEALVHSQAGRAVNLLAIGRYADWNSKLCRWGTGAARESIGQTFTNQALNTLYSFANKAFPLAAGTWFVNLAAGNFKGTRQVMPGDCRQIDSVCEYWITDPPYADAVNYHELSEFFLAWYDKPLRRLFPTWYADSKRSLAVRGIDGAFRQSMLEGYGRLATRMPEDGRQVVMFTHQDVGVWADLTLILWASGLSVTAAWFIQTEREAAGVRDGNYVQGTVFLVLKKRQQQEGVFLDEINYAVEAEVRRQLDTMRDIDDKSDPSFGDTDLQLAAYAAALRVLTAQPIVEIDPVRELRRERGRNEIGPVEQLIRDAVRVACDHLLPRDFDSDVWKSLSPMERFYLKGLELESHGEYRSGVYQELARGFGAADYTELLASTRANETRLKTATELGRRNLSGDGFGGSLVRRMLFAVYKARSDDATVAGLNYLRTEPNPDEYWRQRSKVIHLLDYLAALGHVSSMAHWQADAAAARLLSGAVRNDHV